MPADAEPHHELRPVHAFAIMSLVAWYDRKVMQNAIRSSYVEFQVQALLGDDWAHVGQDWGGWDFQRHGIRLEVKQSAARQSWHTAGEASRGSFDIAARTGHYVGNEWQAHAGRQADMYVFAWHGVYDDTCDQRDERQWDYYVVAASDLPDQATISLGPLRAITDATPARDLAAAVNAVASGIEPRSPSGPSTAC